MAGLLTPRNCEVIPAFSKSSFKFHVYMWVSACLSVYYFYARCPWGEKRTLGPLGLKLKTVMSHHVGSGGPNEISLQEQSAFLTAEPSLQSSNVSSVCANCFTAATELIRCEMLALVQREPCWCQRNYFKWFLFIFLIFEIKMYLYNFFFSVLLQSLSCIHFHALSQM